MELKIESLPRFVDVTEVSAQARLKDIEHICKIAKAYNCAATIVNPCYLTCTLKHTIGFDEILKGTAICFPLGCDLTSVKVYSAKQSEIMGAQEIEMMMNIGAFLSGNLKYAKQDIDAVCDSVKIPVKVVIETALLSDSEIATAASLVTKTKAAFIKTSTGFYGSPTTVDTIRIIKDAVGDSIPLKASGGIRSLEDLFAMAELGVERFGINGAHALTLFQQIDKRLNRESPEL